MDWVTWINTGVGIIGIVVGIIGWKSLSTATKIKNFIKANTVQQAQVIHNGLDAYAVIRLSRETTQEELKKVIDTMQMPVWEEIDDLVTAKVNDTNAELQKLKNEVDNMPKIYTSTEEPTTLKTGDIWFKVE